MKSRFAVPWALALAGLLLAWAVHAGQSNQAIQVIEMSAKKYEFGPSEIHVKKGAHVQIKLRPTDKAHGLKLKAHAEGSDSKGPAGIRFVGESSIKVEKGQDGTLEFFAERPGTYLFECAKFCGFGHGGMKGKLIVTD